MPRTRLLNERLAAVVATLRHGEMIFLADAGSGSHRSSLVPLAADVERLDLGIAPGVPSIRDLVTAITAAGDIEGAIVSENMRDAWPEGRSFIDDTFGAEHVHDLRYLPDFYQLRDRVKLFVQTGDYNVHANVVLIGGYPSPEIPLPWLVSAEWRTEFGFPADRG